MPELNHANHDGVAFAESGTELRATAVTPVVVDLADVATGSPLTYTLTNADNRRSFFYDGTAALTVYASSVLLDDWQGVIVGTGRGTVTLDYDDNGISPWAVPAGWPDSEVTFEVNSSAAPFAVSIMVVSGARLMLAGGVTTQDTVTVHYASGWPTTRPIAANVLAVGHTSAPSWLTATDVWFEDVS